ncbi:Uncharacterized protein Adt_40370 [Abeliophyllum distichum]|uniref:Uncharacterized protein n=1 Tax=Abeliophyllum distichum TaxID=126358 RepID=A0ABD1Q7R6_9LAMI
MLKHQSLGSKTRPFSIGSSLEMNMSRNSNKNMMDCGKEDTLRKERENRDSLVSDVKLSKVLSKVKYVRTIRDSGYVVDEIKRETTKGGPELKISGMKQKHQMAALSC